MRAIDVEIGARALRDAARLRVVPLRHRRFKRRGILEIDAAQLVGSRRVEDEIARLGPDRDDFAGEAVAFLALILVRHRVADAVRFAIGALERSEEHTSELQSLMRTSYAVFCLKK